MSIFSSSVISILFLKYFTTNNANNQKKKKKKNLKILLRATMLRAYILTLFGMGFFGPAHTYTLPKEDQKIYKSRDTPLKFC